MLEALETYMPEGATWTRPEGGMFIWVSFKNGIDTDELFRRAIEKKVAFIPGSNFYPQGAERKNELRLNFSYCSIEMIKEGIRRLGELAK